ncbi:hypothetical protein QBC47DRAFT_406048 [Echria macrotheca]|uniref:VOC domain-containing protein n=1 Tax=Echria macrotheca TaxID=438768 RepID=A0AAJ0F5G9_9PEZI|nr:hypothetical protein QBC47DRAFT_406048 [Echria macrotheca]
MSQPDNSYTNSPGEICWLEIPVTEPSRAIAFYRAVFGWQLVHADGQPTPGYMDGVEGVYLFSKGKLSGAFLKLANTSDVASVADVNSPAKSAVLPYLMVGDVDVALGEVEKNGGRVHVPKILIAGGSMGQCARFVDTEGNLVAIWAPPASA